MIAFVFPGQGAQQVGMGRALVETYPEARRTFDEADAAFAEGASDSSSRASESEQSESRGRTLSALCFEGPEDQLMLTETTQPAILATSIAACRVLEAQGIRPAFVAGHSLGEYSANVAAGTIAFADAVRLVKRRGRYMQEAVPVGVGAMAAVLGLDVATVEQACAEAAQGEVVSPANINAPGQVSIAGHAGAVQRASERAKALGAKRVIPLSVSAPFHCALMMPAEARLEPELRDLATRAPRVPVVANVDAQPKREAWAAIDALVRQVSAPVRWSDTVERLASEGVTTYVEVGPGTVLSGLIRKIHKEARVVQFGSPDHLGAIAAACSTSAEK